MLPGLIPVGASASMLSVFDTLTFVATANGGTATITIPGTPTAGDICVIFNAANNSNNSVNPTTVIPSGFTELRNDVRPPGGSDIPRAIISAKILNGTKTTVTGMDDSA